MKTRIAKSEEKIEKNVMSIQECCSVLGVAYNTMKQILDSGELTYRKVGRRYLITRAALNDWLAFKPSAK